MSKPYNSFEIQDLQDLFTKAGSFWSTHTENFKEGRHLVKAASKVKLFNQMQNAFDNVLSSGNTEIQDTFVTFNPKDVEYTGFTPYDSAFAYGQRQRSISISASANLDYWLQEIPNITTTQVAIVETQNGEFHLGVRESLESDTYKLIQIDNGNISIVVEENPISVLIFNETFVNEVNRTSKYKFKITSNSIFLSNISEAEFIYNQLVSRSDAQWGDFGVGGSFEATWGDLNMTWQQLTTATNLGLGANTEITSTSDSTNASFIEKFNTAFNCFVKIVTYDGLNYYLAIKDQDNTTNSAHALFSDGGVLMLGNLQEYTRINYESDYLIEIPSGEVRIVSPSANENYLSISIPSEANSFLALNIDGENVVFDRVDNPIESKTFQALFVDQINNSHSFMFKIINDELIFKDKSTGELTPLRVNEFNQVTLGDAIVFNEDENREITIDLIKLFNTLEDVQIKIVYESPGYYHIALPDPQDPENKAFPIYLENGQFKVGKSSKYYKFSNLNDFITPENITSFTLLETAPNVLNMGFSHPILTNEYFLLIVENGKPKLVSYTSNENLYQFKSNFLSVINYTHDATFKLKDNRLFFRDVNDVNNTNYHPIVASTQGLSIGVPEGFLIQSEIKINFTWLINFNSNPYTNIKIIQAADGKYYLAIKDEALVSSTLAYPIALANGSIRLGQIQTYPSDRTIQVKDHPILSYGEGSTYYYKLPRPKIDPISIQTEEKKLFLNNDFFVTPKHIFFVDNPLTLFPKKKYLVSVGYQTQKSIHEFPIKVAGLNQPNFFVSKYARGNQSIKALELALAEIAGFGILSKEQKLLAIKKHPLTDATVYTFEYETHIIEYDHTQLEVGKTYPKYYIVGEGIKIYSKQNQKGWWKTINWRGGFFLDTISNFKSIFVPNKDVLSFVHSVDAQNDKCHVLLNLEGDAENLINYWDFCVNQEKKQRFYLNDVIGFENNPALYNNAKTDFDEVIADYNNQKELSVYSSLNIASLEHTKTVNPIDVLFEALLDLIGIVIIVDMRQIRNLSAFTQFLQKEIPFGTCPIVMFYDTMTEGTYEIDNKVTHAYSVTVDTP